MRFEFVDRRLNDGVAVDEAAESAARSQGVSQTLSASALARPRADKDLRLLREPLDGHAPRYLSVHPAKTSASDEERRPGAVPSQAASSQTVSLLASAKG